MIGAAAVTGDMATQKGTPPGLSTVSVVIPTYRRPANLRRCLEALARQAHPVREIIVVHRADDQETIYLLDQVGTRDLPLRSVHTSGPGVVRAYNAGLEAAVSDVVAITDDDAAPWPDWVARIAAAFSADSRLTGLGGRDRLYVDGKLLTGEEAVVGKVQWFGRTIGAHHLGYGTAREVDILKGVNMSFRRSAVGEARFDGRFRGQGAQVDCELAFSLALKRRGGKLVYDPEVVVDHFTAQRHDLDQRHENFNAEALINRAHNETLALLDHLPLSRRFMFSFYAILIGSRAVPGIMQGFRLRRLGLDRPRQRVIASLKGRFLGWKTWRGRDRSV